MAETIVNRRRALTLMAAASALPLLAHSVAHIDAASANASTWSGTALGANARIVFAGTPAHLADRHVLEALAEVERLEQIFSLYRADSELSLLNRDGRLARPSPELLQVLHVCRAVHLLSDGLFDPAIETLWHKKTASCDPIPLVTRFASVKFDRHEVILPDGAALTLNGIAQGYITDRITELLNRAGYRSVLVDMGETRTTGFPAATDQWRIAIRDAPDIIAMNDGAIATSSSSSLDLCPGMELSHIVDPHTGATPRYWRSLTVRHPSATWADALSTALILAPAAQIARVRAAMPGLNVSARPV